MTFDELSRSDLIAAAARLAEDFEFSPYRGQAAAGDVRAAHFVLFVGGRLRGFLEDQLDNEPGEIDDWLAVQLHERRKRFWFAVCASREEALDAMAREPERGRP